MGLLISSLKMQDARRVRGSRAYLRGQSAGGDNWVRLDRTGGLRVGGGYMSETQAAVAALIRREYGLEISLVTVGRSLNAWGLSPQKLVRRAYERNDRVDTRWLTQDYSALARQAKRERAVLYWGDEIRHRSDHVTGCSYAPVGQTPVTRAIGQRFDCNMIGVMFLCR